ncbi:hypothetical protein D3C78_1500260 [compost metagenome]
MAGLDEDLAVLQDDSSLLLIEAHVQRTVGVEVDHRAIGQAQGALLARGGALVGQPIADGQVAFAGKQAQANHQHHAGHAAAQLAYPTSNAVPRLH